MGFALEVLGVAIALSAAMGVAWLVAERTGRSGWIDAIWTFATGLAGMALALLPASPGALRPILVAGLALLWSLRLGGHIVLRTARGGDDPRYRESRAEWGDEASGRLFWFLQVQAAAGLVLASSIAAAAHRPANPARPSRRAGRRAFLRLRPSANERRIGNWPASGETPRINPRSATWGSGAALAIRTIFSSGSSGSPSQSSRSRPSAIIRGVGSASRRPSSCTCCLSTCRESHRWRRTCFGRGVTPSDCTRRG